MARKQQLENLQKELKEQSEFIEQLRSAPAEEVAAIIRHLRTGPSEKSSDHPLARPPELRTARSIPPSTQSGIESELNMLHHSVYPVLEPFEIDSVDLDSPFLPMRRKSPPLSSSPIPMIPTGIHDEDGDLNMP